jgi:hypothetical protein
MSFRLPGNSILRVKGSLRGLPFSIGKIVLHFSLKRVILQYLLFGGYLNSFGENLHITIFGESHGTAVGMALDGLPAGELIDEKAIGEEMRRRAPVPPSWAVPAARRMSCISERSPGRIYDRSTGERHCPQFGR